MQAGLGQPLHKVLAPPTYGHHVNVVLGAERGIAEQSVDKAGRGQEHQLGQADVIESHAAILGRTSSRQGHETVVGHEAGRIFLGSREVKHVAHTQSGAGPWYSLLYLLE